MRAIALTLLVFSAGPAWAEQGIAQSTSDATALPATAPSRTPPPSSMPEVPEAPLEPMPEWTPPPPSQRMNRSARFLSLAPPVQRGQRLRQSGLLISSVGWSSLLAGGICYARTNDNNVVLGISGGGSANRELQSAGWGLMIGGGAAAVVGFALFTAGQWEITAWHKKRPTDPMPSLSGF